MDLCGGVLDEHGTGRGVWAWMLAYAQAFARQFIPRLGELRGPAGGVLQLLFQQRCRTERCVGS